MVWMQWPNTYCMWSFCNIFHTQYSKGFKKWTIILISFVCCFLINRARRKVVADAEADYAVMIATRHICQQHVRRGLASVWHLTRSAVEALAVSSKIITSSDVGVAVNERQLGCVPSVCMQVLWLQFATPVTGHMAGWLTCTRNTASVWPQRRCTSKIACYM